MNIIKNLLHPPSDGCTSSQLDHSKPLDSPSSHRHRGTYLRPSRTIEKSYYINDKCQAPSYYSPEENEDDDEKKRGQPELASGKEEESGQGILFKIGRIAILSPKQSSSKDERNGSGSVAGSRNSGESSRKHDSNPQLESQSLERTKSSRLRKKKLGSQSKNPIKRMITGSSSLKSFPLLNPHSPRSSALRNPATGLRGNEAPPVPPMPPKWTQKARMAEGEARRLPEMKNEVTMVEEGGKKRLPFITVAPESGRKPFDTVGGAAVNQILQMPGENLKVQGQVSDRRGEAPQIKVFNRCSLI